MRRKGQTTTLEERTEICERSEEGQTNREIAQEMDCPSGSSVSGAAPISAKGERDWPLIWVGLPPVHWGLSPNVSAKPSVR